MIYRRVLNFSNVIMCANDTVIFFFLCTVDGSGAKVKYGTYKSTRVALWKQTSLEFEKDRVYDFWYATETLSSGHRRD